MLTAPAFEVADGSFRWSSESAAGSATFVLLGEDYRELARRDGIERGTYRPSGQLADQLRAGARYHAFVQFDDGSGPRRSELCSFAWQ